MNKGKLRKENPVTIIGLCEKIYLNGEEFKDFSVKVSDGEKTETFTCINGVWNGSNNKGWKIDDGKKFELTITVGGSINEYA